GWKSSKPTGLSDDFTYVMPGNVKKNGIHGQDYFVGEEELMRYLDQVDLGECGTDDSLLQRILLGLDAIRYIAELR
ncbi:hypothetical protein PHMEG_00019919, partial [Phytophthora megakarya]